METKNRRILLIDDNRDIHGDFRKILGADESAKPSQSVRAAFFGEDESDTPGVDDGPGFELVSAFQGLEGIEAVERSRTDGAPFAMAFVDVRMPPGIDGLQTIKRMWELDPDLQVVICTAYSDYSFDEIIDELGNIDRLLILKKPFEPVEVRQLAGALTEKWNVIQRERARMVELEQANDRAEAASLAKSQFLTNMSHEIRTPMNAILGYVDLLCDPTTSSDERVSYGDVVRRSGRHLLTILNDILDLSKIEAGHMELARTSFSPFELAHDVLTLLRPQACEKDLDCDLEVVGPLPVSIRADALRVRQVLLNLVGNAIKFTQHGSVRMVIGMKGTEGTDVPRLHFEVVDTGVGIASEDVPRLFDAFIQADMSNTRAVGGTGLGLAICKRLAEMMDGTIEVESEPGSGSTFGFHLGAEAEELQLEEHSAADCDLERADDSARDASGMPRLPGRVLVVEDGKFNQALLCAVLRKSGAEVTVADNGQEGLDALDRAERTGLPFGLVLMDMQMPVLDGYEATRRLRAAGNPIPVVALTAHAMSGDREKCLAAGCDEYVTKPLDRAALLELCAGILRSPNPKAALPSGTPVRDAAIEKPS